jgi:hypothetical protein
MGTTKKADRVERSLLVPQPRSSGSGAADDILTGPKCATGPAAAHYMGHSGFATSVACGSEMAAIKTHGSIPNSISEAYAQELKSQVRDMVSGDIEDFYPELVLSYASGKRPDDAIGTGPGFVQAFEFIKRLKENGHICFSGLHVPVMQDWNIYFLRLRGDKAKAKIMIALLTHDYFKSPACMRELYTAMEAKVKILQVRMEENMPPPYEDQWKGTMTSGAELERMHVRDFLVKTNAIPHPGTLPTIPTAFTEILKIIEKLLRNSTNQN